MSVLRHQNLRKRTHSAAQYSFPHPNFWIHTLDRATLAAGVIGPIMTFPQIYKILEARTAAGVSILSWTAFALLDIPFIIYGFVHKDPPIITSYICWFTVNTIVAVLAIVYR